MATTEGTKTPLASLRLEKQLDIAHTFLTVLTLSGCDFAGLAHMRLGTPLDRPTELLLLYCISRC